MAEIATPQNVPANIFVRVNPKTKKTSYSISYLKENGKYEDGGFVMPLKAAREALESSKAVRIPGKSKAGPYEQLRVWINPKDIVKVNGIQYLGNIAGLR